jgi:hypothetical protein
MNVMILFNRAVLPSFEFGCPKIKSGRHFGKESSGRTLKSCVDWLEVRLNTVQPWWSLLCGEKKTLIIIMHPLVRDLFKRFIIIGRDYPVPPPYVRNKAADAFRKNAHITSEKQVYQKFSLLLWKKQSFSFFLPQNFIKNRF